nr:hypothetical protein B0A51_05374 [Rachicladosporium sp. CCFEE 5018]
MVYVKPTVQFTRLASSALKSFTHGGAQGIVAASQSSGLVQNPAATPLADHLLGRFRKAEKSKTHNAYHQIENVRQASTSHAPATRPETSYHDPGLERYFDAWQKYQRNELKEKEWQQYQFAKRLEWQPPTTVPDGASAALGPVETKDDGDETRTEPLVAPLLRRSYTTSALNDFTKVFINNEAAGDAAIAQVNDAMVEEGHKSKGVVEDADRLSEVSPAQDSLFSETQRSATPASVFTPPESLEPYVSSESQAYTDELLQLSAQGRHHEVPAVFQSMLRAGVQQPAPAAYRALLTAALQLTSGRSHIVPKALEVYSDMLRRKVTPDTATFATLIGLLANRASESTAQRTELEMRRTRYGGVERSGQFMFRSSQAKYTMLLEDSSLSIALKMFSRALRNPDDQLPSVVCASLVRACAEQGRVDDMAQVYEHMVSQSMSVPADIFPPAIAAFGKNGDLRSAVEIYDDYKALAIENNAGQYDMERVDNDVYASLIKAYGLSGRLEGGLKFFEGLQNVDDVNAKELEAMRETVVLSALLPVALQDTAGSDAITLTASLSGRALASAWTRICINAADRDSLKQSEQAFSSLARLTQDLSSPAVAMLAMHIRNSNVEAAAPYWAIMENALATLLFVEPTTMRTIALLAVGQAERGLRQTRRMFSRIRDSQAESAQPETANRIDEAIEVIGRFVLGSSSPMQPETGAELLRMMTDNGGLVTPTAEHVMARFGPQQIARLTHADIEFTLRVQAGMVINESAADIAGPERFGCILENLVAKSVMPSAETETIIERTLVNINRTELSRLWNNYRYPPTPVTTPVAFSPVLPFQPPVFDEAFDPYAAKTDIKGSNMINELLERPHGRRLSEALTRFRNMRRVGRVPRMFTYGKLIEGAAKENNLRAATDILEMAKQDVPFDMRYRVVRFGWQQILDQIVAGCLNVNRRDLAARYHQDMTEMGAAPSANTFGLYITTLKENTKTFDEATEAVKIFHQAKAEGVEPSSFLYNALIGKLGKARRIDDCLFYFAEMRNTGIKPTSVTYGTVVNALCRVSDDKFAVEIFEEMESASNYKPRPAPYHSLMQFFLTTKRNKAKVLSYYERMRGKNIEPTMHTFKLLIDAHATLEPVDMRAAESVLTEMASAGLQPEAVHYASLIHAKGCTQQDVAGAQAIFDSVIAAGMTRLQPCMYQALYESFNANHQVELSEPLLQDMRSRHVEFTPYIANALIHGYTLQHDLQKAKAAFGLVAVAKREPSTYEVMVRAYLAAEDREGARGIVKEALGRGYPSAVAGKIAELVR